MQILRGYYHRRDECRVLRVLRSEELALPGIVVSFWTWKRDLSGDETYLNLCSRCSSNLTH
jgi:hypothetical protein